MDIKLLKKLREETKASMLACKNALIEFHDDYDKALAHLRSHIKKEDGNQRVASKGMCHIEIDKDEAVLFEVNAETDFVTKNEQFVSTVKHIGRHLLASDVTNAKTALKVEIDGSKVEDIITHMSAIISEHAQLRRFYRVKKESFQSFGSYIHMQGKLVTLVVLDKDDQELANQLAMQVAAMNAHYLKIEDIDQDTINYERFMYEKIHGSMDEADFTNELQSKTLLSQPWIKDPKKTVSDVLKKQDVEIIDFFKFELGQGIDNKLNCRLDIPCDGSKITVTPIL